MKIEIVRNEPTSGEPGMKMDLNSYLDYYACFELVQARVVTI
jgi:hypothetical protein